MARELEGPARVALYELESALSVVVLAVRRQLEDDFN
jgi:hypothetical protein